MLEYIYVCRHGFRSNWIDPNIKTSPTGMNRDPPLAVYGHEQAEHLASFLSNTNQTHPYPIPELVFSSPFYRCIETSLPTAKQLGLTEEDKKGKGIMLEHGVQEWYSPIIPSTGLHPRPGSPQNLSKYFPSNSIDLNYSSTVFPSRKGESLIDLHERADLFIESWTSKIEALFPEVKSVVIFAHAASIIALGRALTGNRNLDVVAGCASTSLYKRKSPSSTIPSVSETFESTLQPHREPFDSRPPSSLAFNPSISSGLGAESSPALGHLSSGLNGTETPPAFAPLSRTSSPPPPAPPPPSVLQSNNAGEVFCGVGEWQIIWNGKADYLPNGLERNWSFKDVILKDNGEVIDDKGDGGSYTEKDELPVGLNVEDEKWLRRGKPPFVGDEKRNNNVGPDVGSAKIMGADAGFDMVPMLEAKDQSKWDLFLDEVKETFKGDPKMLLKKDKIEFDAVIDIAREHFGHRVEIWNELCEVYGYYSWGKINDLEKAFREDSN